MIIDGIIEGLASVFGLLVYAIALNFFANRKEKNDIKKRIKKFQQND